MDITADTLDSHVEFDCPFTITEDGLGDAPGVRAPGVYTSEDTDLEVDSSGWRPVAGFSGQDGYDGPIMHPSEYLGGGMARWVLETPGTYVVTEVQHLEDLEALVGWVLLERV